MKKREKPTVLLLLGYYTPEVFASSGMCTDVMQRLAADGMSVEVLCPMPTRGVSAEVRAAYKKRRKECPAPGVTVRRFPLYKEPEDAKKRFIRYALQNAYQLFYALFHHYDLLFLYSTPPTNGALGALLRQCRLKPFVYNLHDVFPDSMVGSGMIQEGSRLWRLGRRMEDYSYRHADLVVAISDGIRSNLHNKGVPVEKTAVVHTWVDETRIVPVPRAQNTLAAECGIGEDCFTVTYAGNIGEAQSVQTVLEAAELLREENIRFVIIGNGAKERQCKEFAGKHQLDKVQFLPMQPPERLSEVYSLGDVSLVTCRRGFGTCGMPSKTGSILSAGTALLASFDTDSDLNDLLQRAQAGVCVEPENPEALAQAILALAASPQTCTACGENGRAYLLANMTAEHCTQQLADLVRTAMEK